MGVTSATNISNKKRSVAPLRTASILSRALLLMLALLLSTCKAQQKSTNVQSINGQSYYIHTIQKKQSLYAISKLYNVSVDTLFELNPELRNGAKADQQIKVPVVSSAENQEADTSRYITHKVIKGETVYSLTRKYNISEKRLLEYNPVLAEGLKEDQLIIVGEKSKKRTREKLLPVPTPTLQLPSLPIDSARFRPFSKPEKPLYNVSVLLPFKLQKVPDLDPQQLQRSNGSFPGIQALAADFYLGCKKAADSLQSPGFATNLQLYDIDDDDSVAIRNLKRDPAFNASDLIIGPLYANSFAALSQKASEMHTPIISPFTRQNKILFNNIYISKTNPSQYTLLESLADYCIDSLMQDSSNFILMTVSLKDRREGNYAEAFKAYFNNRVVQMGRAATDTIRTTHIIDSLASLIKPGYKNVVIALNSNEVFIANFTTQLAMMAAGKNVRLCGWESVTGMDNIDQEYLNQLQYTFPHEYNVSTRAIPALDNYYKSHQHTSPSEFYYVGFDLAYYYLKNLKERGPDFVYELDQIAMELNYLRFKFARPDFTTGFDNRGVYIFRYKDYQLHKTGWK